MTECELKAVATKHAKSTQPRKGVNYLRGLSFDLIQVSSERLAVQIAKRDKCSKGEKTPVSGYCSLKPDGKCNGPRTMDRKKWTFDGKTRMCRSVFGCLSEEKESKFNSFLTLKSCKDAVRNHISDLKENCCNDLFPGNPHEFDKTEGWCIPSIADRTMNNKGSGRQEFGFWWGEHFYDYFRPNISPSLYLRMEVHILLICYEQLLISGKWANFMHVFFVHISGFSLV